MRRRLATLLVTAVIASAASGCSSSASPEATRCKQAQQAFADFSHKAGSLPPEVPSSPAEAARNEKQRENFELNGRYAANVVMANQSCFTPKTVAIMKTWLDNRNESQ